MPFQQQFIFVSSDKIISVSERVFGFSFLFFFQLSVKIGLVTSCFLRTFELLQVEKKQKSKIDCFL